MKFVGTVRYTLLLCSLAFAGGSGCGVTLRAGYRPSVPSAGFTVEEHAATRCMHGTAGRSNTSVDFEALVDAELEPFLAELSPSVRRTAAAAGLERLLARLVRERAHVAAGADAGGLLHLRDELTAQMFALETQLLAVEFEVDCVRGLIHDVLSDYEEAETDRQLALTIASLVVGTGTAIASAAWDLANGHTDAPAWNDGPLVTSIIGALATTTIGVWVVLPPAQEVAYLHQRNLLKPVLDGVDPQHVYPTFVFRLLTLPVATGVSPRDELVATFDTDLEDTVAPEQRTVARAILFGDGGTHDVRLLELYQDMLEELGATLDGLARDIDALGNTVAELLRA